MTPEKTREYRAAPGMYGWHIVWVHPDGSHERVAIGGGFTASYAMSRVREMNASGTIHHAYARD